jgi:hypothetical protein
LAAGTGDALRARGRCCASARPQVPAGFLPGAPWRPRTGDLLGLRLALLAGLRPRARPCPPRPARGGVLLRPLLLLRL